MGGNSRTLDTSSLENWLWDAACVIRGPLDAPKFKDYILPLIFLKRLSDVFQDELEHLGHEFGDRKTAAHLVDEDHGLVRFYIPGVARWKVVSQKTTGLGEHLTDAVRAVARENPRLQGVIDVVDFNATAAGQRIVDDGRLVSLVQVLSQHRLAEQSRKESNLSREGFAVFWLLKRQGIDSAETVAREAASAFEQYPHWQRSSNQEMQVRRSLYKALVGAGIKEMKEIADGIMNILRRSTY